MTESNRVEQVPSHEMSVGRVGSMLKVTGQMKGRRVPFSKKKKILPVLAPQTIPEKVGIAGGPGGRVPPFTKGTGGAASLLHVQALPKPLCLAQVTEVGKKIIICFKKIIHFCQKN